MILDSIILIRLHNSISSAITLLVKLVHNLSYFHHRLLFQGLMSNFEDSFLSRGNREQGHLLPSPEHTQITRRSSQSEKLSIKRVLCFYHHKSICILFRQYTITSEKEMIDYPKIINSLVRNLPFHPI